MISKDDISSIKKNPDELKVLLLSQRDIKKIVFILENLGRLPKNLNYDFIVELLKNDNEKIRLLAIKNVTIQHQK